MGSFAGTCEIVELKDDLNSVQYSRGIHRPNSGLRVDDRDRKPPLLKVRCNDSLENDLNQLFEAINLKGSPKVLSLSHQVGAGPSRKNASKRQVGVGVSHSPGTEISEPVTLKQALRGLCISQASEMAAMKRLSKSTASPRISEAERIKNLYRAVVIEAGESGLSLDSGKQGIEEISLVPEESTSTSSEKMPHYLQVARIKSSNQSAHSSPRFTIAAALKGKETQYEMDLASTFSDKMPQHLQVPRIKSSNQSAHSSPRFAVATAEKGTGTTPARSEMDPASTSSEKMPQHLQVPRIKSSNQSAHSSPRFAVATAEKRTGTTLARSEMDPASTSSEKMPQHLQVPRIKSSNQSAHSSPRFAVATAQKGTGTTPTRNEMVLAPAEVWSQTSKIELAQTETHTSLLPSLSWPHTGENRLQLGKVIPASTKLANKASAPKPGRKGRLQTAPSSSSSMNGNRVSKLTRNTPRLVKPVIRNKNLVKKKLKQDSTSATSTSNTYNEVNSDKDPGTSQLVCQRCQCTLKNERKQSNQGSSASHCTSLRAEVSLNDADTCVSKPGITSDSCNISGAVVKANKNSKSREKGEFSQSSKSSIGEHSSSTSISEESNLSRPSCGNRPHMSKDVRWGAIRHVRMQHSTLGLKQFNLLKKLGCGDIGTVYLAELIGTDCLFAIKVMDIEYLARRKKLPRAQTEREILKMLDHPFLPTLYAQFTADNMSCLVMEYCPGGDLHVLRQKQPGRNFPEQAARFYVAEVLLALEYLHMLGVVYRDLKPENILVREDGHIMLTDFDLSLRCSVNPTLLKSSSTAESRQMSGPCTGSNCIDPFCIEPSCQVPCFSPRLLPAAAKARKLKSNPAAQVRSLPQVVVEPTDARSNSFVGTHEYLAPEIIKGDGHGSAVDWWTFGIFLFELLYGKTPFKGSGNEETLANVVVQSLKFPDSPLVSFEARDLIRGLLVKEPEYRLGWERGAAEIKQHPFFQGLNWALIRCAVPPELPEFCDYGVMNMASEEMKSKYLDYRATGEQLEFELF